MSCALCESSNEREFSAEICIHVELPGNLDRPGVLVFPKLVVCLDCGSSRFTIPETELALLSLGTATGEGPTRRRA
jgi:hypothetical protein